MNLPETGSLPPLSPDGDDARTGLLSLIGSVVGGRLGMGRSEIGTLLMREGAKFQEVDLRGAKIAGQVSMIGSTFAGTLDMDHATVGGDLYLRGADLTKAPLDGRGLSVAGMLDLRWAKVSTIDLRGATVVGELRLFESVWEPGSILDLRHAKVGRLGAHVGQSSPGATKLAGFICDALGSTANQTGESESVEEAADFVERWLREEEAHSPQAHEQFALVLRQMGFPDRARRTLYEGKNHELRDALSEWRVLDAAWLLLKWAFIGYGYRVWHALIWIAGLLLAGWIVVGKAGVKTDDRESFGFWYTLDRLLPIVELRKRHYEVDLPFKSRVYFYFHTMMGYVLATFLLAGMSGLVG